MSEAAGRGLGEVRAEIAARIVQLQSEYYGKGPTKARTYFVDDLVVVDDRQAPVGIVDSQDLTKLKLL